MAYTSNSRGQNHNRSRRGSNLIEINDARHSAVEIGARQLILRSGASLGPLGKFFSVPSVTAIKSEYHLFVRCALAQASKGMDAMDSGMKTETDEKILSSDVPDEALERAANTEQTAVTWIYCTNHWYSCDWPQ